MREHSLHVLDQNLPSVHFVLCDRMVDVGRERHQITIGGAVRWISRTVTKLGDPSARPGTHMVEEGN